MTRVEELKRELDKGSSVSLDPKELDPQTIVAKARQLQSQEIGRAVRAAISGIAGLGRAFGESVRRWQRRTRTAAELERLNDRMLADIGLTRADIDPVAARLAGARRAGPSFLARLAIRFKGARVRRQTIRELSTLSDSALNDIGLGRDDIRYVADRLSALHVALALSGHIDIDRPLSATARDARMVANTIRSRQGKDESAAERGLVAVLGDIDWLSEAIVRRTPRGASNRNESVGRAA